MEQGVAYYKTIEHICQQRDPSVTWFVAQGPATGWLRVTVTVDRWHSASFDLRVPEHRDVVSDILALWAMIAQEPWPAAEYRG